jgi:hypothetical protein
MRKLILVTLLIITTVNLVFLIIALTNETSKFYEYRLGIGLAFLMFGGFLRQHLLSYNKKTS